MSDVTVSEIIHICGFPLLQELHPDAIGWLSHEYYLRDKTGGKLENCPACGISASITASLNELKGTEYPDADTMMQAVLEHYDDTCYQLVKKHYARLPKPPKPERFFVMGDLNARTLPVAVHDHLARNLTQIAGVEAVKVDLPEGIDWYMPDRHLVYISPLFNYAEVKQAIDGVLSRIFNELAQADIYVRDEWRRLKEPEVFPAPQVAKESANGEKSL